MNATERNSVAGSIFNKHYNNRPNILTPNKIASGYVTPNVLYEISSGRGIARNTIYGVTIIGISKIGITTSLHDDSKTVGDLQEAEDYIQELRTKYK